MLTYDEIVNIEFPKSTFGGYKTESVDEYIDNVSDTVKSLLEQIKSANDKVAQLEKEISEYKSTESSLRAALVFAQETGQKLINEATEKSEEIIAQANQHSEEVISTSEKQANDTISAASKESSELLKISKEKASEILREALIKANSITQKAKENCAAEEAYFEQLKKKVNDFRTSMLLLYKSHVELLNEMRPKDSEDADSFESQKIKDDFDSTEDSDIVENTIAAEVDTDSDDFEDVGVDEVDLEKIKFDDFSDDTDCESENTGFEF